MSAGYELEVLAVVS